MINEINFEDTSEYRVVYIKFIGKDCDNKNIYQFFLSKEIEEVFSEGWSEKPACNIREDILMIDNEMYEYIKELHTDIYFDLAQNNCCFSMQDARDHCIALASENLDNAEEYPEKGRIVIMFGDYIDDVERILAIRDMRMRFV